MEKILKYLEELELSEIEAKFYLTLLETGPTSVRDVALKIGIKRTTAYLYVEQLMQKGLVIKITKSSKTQIAPTNPDESLQALVEKNVQKAKSIEGSFPKILNDIKTTFPNFKEVDQFEIKYFKGVNGIRRIYQDALNARELRSYIKLIENDPVFPDNVVLFTEAFKINTALQVKEIFYESSNVRLEALKIQETTDRYAYKFMPNDMKLNSEDILIYDGRVAIVHYKGKHDCTGVVLQSTDYYNNSVEFFDFIWKKLPDSK